MIVVAAAGVYIMGKGDSSSSNNGYDGDSVTVTTFTDYNGNTAELVFENVPDRVVAGCNTALNLLLHLGLGDKIVGIYYNEEPVWDEVADEYQKVIDRIGKDRNLPGNISTDVLLSWEPDLVIGWVSWNNEGLGSVDFFKDNGCNVMSFNTMTSSTYRNLQLMKIDYDNIGKIFNCSDETTELYNHVVDVYNKVSVDLKGKDPIHYALIDGAVNSEKGTIWAYKNTNFMASILNSMGMVNAFPTGGTVSLATVYETIGTTNIDLLIYITYGKVTYEQSYKSWAEDADLSKCDAIKNNHCIDMKLSCSYGTSPELLDILESVADYISKM